MINKINITKFDDEELWLLYAEIQQELRKRNRVRTNNIVGERGEFLAIETYNRNKNLVNLYVARAGTQYFDASSKKGDRYTIKTIREPGNTTGVFFRISEKDGTLNPEQKFEYVIIVQLFKNYTAKRIVEVTWEQFLKHKKWHSVMRAWNISVTRALLSDAKIILDNTN